MFRFPIIRCLSIAIALQALQIAPAQQVPSGRAPGGQLTGQDNSSGQNGVGGQSNAQRDPSVQIPIMSSQAAVAAGVAQVAPQQPFEALTPQVESYLDQVLNIWEQRTANVNQFQCDFKRWEFDPGSHPTAAITIAAGVIKFAKPDKGMFRVDTLKSIVSTDAPKPEYQVNPRRPHGDYWICDGSWVHNIDRNEKKAIRTELPPEMRGNQIHLSPIPFLFGVKSTELKQRYWLRPIAPPSGNNDVWIEAYPKRADDAGNYSQVVIVLDRDELLPKSLTVMLPNWTKEKPVREVYEFENRDQMGGLLNAIKQKVFMQDFINTKLPSDWQVIEEPWVAQQAQAAQEASLQGQGSPALTQQPGGLRPQGQPQNRVASPGGNPVQR